MNDPTDAIGLPDAATADRCPNCDTPNLDGATFCIRCATPLEGVASTFEPTPLSLAQRTVQCTVPEGAKRIDDRSVRASTSVHALPDGTRIEGFRIVRPLGEGGFGIVYLAWDEALERHVAIKEYMPYALAMREDASLDLTVRAERDRSVFDAGLKGFVNEARLLARFDHPALVKVLRFWEANRTAYMAMPYYEGPTLKAALADVRHPASEQQLRDWLGPLLAALTVMHREQCYHRDISPDNILLTAGGPLLLDFGAARRVISDRTQALTAMLKPGFAPIEQYGGTMLQGPWTDLYALAGVVRYAITGRPPVASVGRVVDDVQRPLAQTHAGRYGDGFLRAIDAALAVRPEHRPQDVAAFRALLAVGQPADGAPDFPRTERIAPIARPLPPPPPSPPVPRAPPAPPRAAPRAPRAAPAPREGEPTAFGGLFEIDGPTLYPTTLRVPGSPSPRRRRSRMPLLAGVALLVAAGAAWFAMSGSPAPTTAAAVPQAPAAPVVRAAAPAPVAPVAAVAAVVPVAPAAPAAPSPIVQAPPATPPSTAVAPTAPSSPPVVAGAASRLPDRTVRAVERPQGVALATPVSARPASSKPAQTAPVEASEGPEVTFTYTQPARPPRCGDLVLKASLETLQPDEIAFLKSRCR